MTAIKHFNVLPQRPRPPRALWIGALLAWTAFILVAVTLTLEARAAEHRLRTEADTLRVAVAEIERQAAPARAIVALAQAFQGAERELAAKQADFGLLATIEAVAPEAFWFASVELTGRAATLSGAAARWEIVTRTVRSLDRAGLSTTLQNVQSRHGVYGFTLRALSGGSR